MPYRSPIGVQSGRRIFVFALVTLLGAGNAILALIDAYRERFPTLDGYVFIGIATLIPYGIGAVGMLFHLGCTSTKYWFWSVGTAISLLPGVLIWSVYASMPFPRIHHGAGQMHIFFLPFLHIGYCLLVYFGVALLSLVIHDRSFAA